MNPRLSAQFALFWLLVLAALSAVGCKSNGNQELLERELRCKDDTIYELQDQVEDMEQKLESCQRENSTLKRDVHGGGPSRPGDESSPLPPRNTERTPSDIERPLDVPRRPRSDISVPELPKIDLGTPAPPGDTAPPSESSAPGARASSGSSIPPLLRAPGGEASAISPASGDVQSASGTEPSEAMPPMSSAADVQRIAINRILSGSHSFGSHPGNDGIRVVFTTRDAADRPILAPGAVSVAVVDPEATGPAERVARWDFSPEETAAHFRPTSLSKGYHFDLIWPDHPPAHDRVKMYVRFSTPDGRKFDAQQTIHIAGPDAKHWSMISPAPAPQQWEATTVPIGAQFDPVAAPPHDTAEGLRTVVFQSTPNSSAVSPPTTTPLNTTAPTATSDPSTAPAAAVQTARGGRPVWSPYR